MMKWKIISYQRVGSTQLLAKKYILKNKINQPTVIVSKTQLHGYGRYGRKWYSPQGGLWCSIVFKPNLSIGTVHFITIISALAVVKTIEKEFKLPVKIKWPNDITIENKKVCGILSETINTPNGNYMVVGIGINVNNRIPQEIKEEAISIRKFKKDKADIYDLLQKLLRNFSKYYALAQSRKNNLLELYIEYSSILNKFIRIRHNGNIIEGVVEKIEPDGIILRVGKSLEKIISGTVISYQ